MPAALASRLASPPPLRFALRALAFAVALPLGLVLGPGGAARADSREDAREDAFNDGEVDHADFATDRWSGALGARTPASRRSGASDVQDETWVSLGAFGGRTPEGATQLGAMAVVGIALDRIAAGHVHGAFDRGNGFAVPPAPAPTQPPTPSPSPPVTPANGAANASTEAASVVPPLDGRLARAVVLAAWKAAGIGADDARVDEMVARARTSAALPETRLRVLKQIENGSQLDTTVDESRYYDTIGAGLWLEARLTWRLDRLLYADDEPTLERVRLERQEARSRLAAHVMEALVGWQRAIFDRAVAPVGSRERVLADLRRVEAEAMLDVLTGGRFEGLTASRPRASP